MIPIEAYNLPKTPPLSIGDAARAMGISVNLLRLYENEGLILPARTEGNQRRYSREDLERVSCIRRAIQEEKMTISSIRKIMALVPCWEIVGCSEEDRTHCEAFHSTVKGCWNYEHVYNTCATRECRDCEVYRSSGDCSQIKNVILRATTNHSNGKENEP
jgi:MerR family transcriptional regulator/heat shock protein HspR